MNAFLAATFASFGTRNYRLFFAGQTASVIGSWMQKLAQAWLVLELTGSGTWLGVVVAVQHFPSLILSPWAGVLADRYAKRSVLLWSAAAAIIPAAALCVLSFADLITLQILLGLALLTGLAESLEKPARHAFPSELVRPGLVTNAVTLNNVIQESGKAVGPALAALLIASVGLPYTFLINAISYVAVFAGLLLMKPAELISPPLMRRGRGQLWDGLVYVRRTPHLLGTLALLTVAGLLVYNFQVLLPVFGWTVFDGDARTVGFLLAVYGAGAVLGGLALAGLLAPTPRRIMLAALLLGGCLAATAASPVLWVAMVLVFLLGVSSVAFRTLASSWLQLTADPVMRGRVISLLVLAVAGTSPVGAPLVGWLADVVGARATFVIAGAITALAAVATYAYMRSRAYPVLTVTSALSEARSRRTGRRVSGPDAGIAPGPAPAQPRPGMREPGT